MSIVSVSTGTGVASGGTLTLPTGLVAGNWLVAVLHIGIRSSHTQNLGYFGFEITNATLGAFETLPFLLNERTAIQTGDPNSLSFSFGGQTTSTLTRPLANTTVISALEGLSSVGTNNVSCVSQYPDQFKDSEIFWVNGLGGTNVAGAVTTAQSSGTATITVNSGGASQHIMTNGFLVSGNDEDYSVYALFKKQITGAETNPVVTFNEGYLGWTIYQLNTPVGNPSYVPDNGFTTQGVFRPIVTQTPGLDILLSYQVTSKSSTTGAGLSWTQLTTYNAPFTKRIDWSYAAAIEDLGTIIINRKFHLASADAYRTTTGTFSDATYTSSGSSGNEQRTRIFIPEVNTLLGWGIPI